MFIDIDSFGFSSPKHHQCFGDDDTTVWLSTLSASLNTFICIDSPADDKEQVYEFPTEASARIAFEYIRINQSLPQTLTDELHGKLAWG